MLDQALWDDSVEKRRRRAKSRMNRESLRRFEAAGLRLAVTMEIHLEASGPGERA